MLAEAITFWNNPECFGVNPECFCLQSRMFVVKAQNISEARQDVLGAIHKYHGTGPGPGPKLACQTALRGEKVFKIHTFCV